MAKGGMFELTGQAALQTPKADSFWVLPEQFLGVEIEIENFSRTQVNRLVRESALWLEHEDRSLRQGTELVFSQPLMGADLTRAISQFFSTVTQYETTPRTSIHVHMNMRQENDSVAVLHNLCVLYYMYEQAFFDIAGEDRQWCTYCSTFEDSAPAVLIAVLRNDSMKEIRAQLPLRDDRRGRYYGLNLLPLNRYGTIEFRHMPCVKDKSLLVEWIQLLMELKQAAHTLADQGVSVYDVFNDVTKVFQLESYMPRFGQRLRSLVNDDEAYRKLQLAHVYRAGPAYQPRGYLSGNPLLSKFIAKALGTAEAEVKRTDPAVAAKSKKGAASMPVLDSDIVDQWAAANRLAVRPRGQQARLEAAPVDENGFTWSSFVAERTRGVPLSGLSGTEIDALRSEWIASANRSANIRLRDGRNLAEFMRDTPLARREVLVDAFNVSRRNEERNLRAAPAPTTQDGSEF